MKQRKFIDHKMHRFGNAFEVSYYDALYIITKTCEAGLVLSVTRILRAALAKFRVYV